MIDEVAAEFTWVDAGLTGLGVFPDRNKPTVVWTGLPDPRPVVALQQQLERRLQEAGWRPDGRTYRPHVTVARINSRRRPVPRVLFEVLETHTATDFGTSRLDNVVLYRSESTPQGMRYTALHRSNLLDRNPAEQSSNQNNPGGN
jgi:2'-5' RNA ligase